MINDYDPIEASPASLISAEPDWKQLFKQAKFGLSVSCAQSNRFIEVNESFASQHGYSPEELKGRPITDIYAPEQHAALFAQLREIDSSGQGTFESLHLRQDGSRFPVVMKITTLFDEQGCPTMRIAYSSDISKHKAIEARLELLSQVVEQSPQAIVITNLESSIEYVNEAFVRNTGYSREELLNQNASLVSSGRTPPERYTEIWDALCAGNACKAEFYNKRKDGSDYAISAVLSPLRNAWGEISHYASINDDITERKRIAGELDRHRARLEEIVAQRTRELKQAKIAAERANEAKSNFLTTMSHEMRTPMNGVIGSVEVLTQSNLSAEQRELTTTIRESALGLLHIIDDILDLSKIEAGRMELDQAPLQIESLAESICDALGPMAQDRNVTLDLYTAPNLPFEIVSDTMRLRQILNNLLGNAIKFSASSLRRGHVSLRVETEGPDMLRLQVSDNGIGISPENQARLFQPFTQAESSTTRNFGGTGLGLSICLRLVTLLGGRLMLSSEEGKGATFVTYLPMQVASDTVAAPEPPPKLQGVECLLWTRQAQRRQDWSEYLNHAGASVQVLGEGDSPPVPNGYHARVLLVDETVATTEIQAWAQAGLPLVRVGASKGRSPQVDKGGQVRLDSQAMHRLTLLRAVELTLQDQEHANSTEIETRQPVPMALVPEPLAKSSTKPRPLILVAEDNLVNRKVISQQLDLLGYACELAENGKVALQKWREKGPAYALLLTDLHMPEMDGNELAVTIRQEENPQSRLPIITLSANLLDKKAAHLGVDDYLCKPIPLELLGKRIAHWLMVPQDNAKSSGIGVPTATADELPLLDVKVLAELIGDDPDLIKEFLHDYSITLQETADDIQRHSADADWRAIIAVAHKLKSSSYSVGALAMGHCCKALEQADLQSDTTALRHSLTVFDELWPRVLKALQRSLAP